MTDKLADRHAPPSPEPPRIIINTRLLAHPLTGVQRYTREMVARLADMVTTVAPGRALRHGLLEHAWEQIVLPARVGRALLWSPSATGPLLKANQVVTIHDMAGLDHPEWFTRPYGWMYRLIVPTLARRARHILTGSHFTRRRILARTGIPSSRITVTPYGRDPGLCPCPAAQIEDAVRRLDLPSRTYVLSVGTREPRKNLRALLAAWRQVVAELPPDVHLVLVGGTGRASVFRDDGIAADPPRVYRTGYVPDELLPALYSGAMMFIYPSLYEGFGLPPLEAMACGAPVAVATGSAMVEVVGDAGLSFPPDSDEAIAAAIMHLFREEGLRRQLRERGLVQAAPFSWDRTTAQTRTVLNRLLESDGGSPLTE